MLFTSILWCWQSESYSELIVKIEWKIEIAKEKSRSEELWECTKMGESGVSIGVWPPQPCYVIDHKKFFYISCIYSVHYLIELFFMNSTFPVIAHNIQVSGWKKKGGEGKRRHSTWWELVLMVSRINRYCQNLTPIDNKGLLYPWNKMKNKWLKYSYCCLYHPTKPSYSTHSSYCYFCYFYYWYF